MRFLMASVFSLFLSSAAFAWVPAYNYQLNGNTAAVTFWNNTPFTVFCQGYVMGQVQNGATVNTWFADWVGPMQYRTAYVYANYPFYFVNAWTNVNCQ
ncbi:MAG: hypothetical protein J7501_01530 [Bdellovibrio sp.]|nr:hypothetical protein [Bdellovibrio sp.]